MIVAAKPGCLLTVRSGVPQVLPYAAQEAAVGCPWTIGAGVCACDSAFIRCASPPASLSSSMASATCVGVARTSRAKLLVAVIQMLRQFFDDLGFPGRTEAQFGQSLDEGRDSSQA